MVLLICSKASNEFFGNFILTLKTDLITKFIPNIFCTQSPRKNRRFEPRTFCAHTCLFCPAKYSR